MTTRAKVLHRAKRVTPVTLTTPVEIIRDNLGFEFGNLVGWTKASDTYMSNSAIAQDATLATTKNPDGNYASIVYDAREGGYRMSAIRKTIGVVPNRLTKITAKVKMPTGQTYGSKPQMYITMPVLGASSYTNSSQFPENAVLATAHTGDAANAWNTWSLEFETQHVSTVDLVFAAYKTDGDFNFSIADVRIYVMEE